MKQQLVLVSALSLLAACGGSSHTDAPPVASAPAISATQLSQIDEFVKAQMDKQHMPGVSIVVTKDGKPILERGYGLANVAAKASVTPDTVFHIGSITKQFTAAAIMLLVQDGRITLDQPVSMYFPSAPASWKNITIRRLLNHTSGLRRDFGIEMLQQIDLNKVYTIDELVGFAGQLPLDAPTGAAESYSNIGYHLLGFLIQKVSGQYYADFLQSRIFKPLGMSSADVILTSRPTPALATGYVWANGALQAPSTDDRIPGLFEGEGGLQMSAHDLAKWDVALTSGQILSAAVQQQMWTPAQLTDGTSANYGFGWVLDQINNHPFTWHNGALNGYTAQFARHTHEGLSVIVLDNLDSAAPVRISTRISAILNPDLDWALTSDTEPAVTSLMRSLIDQVAAGALVVDDRFTPAAKAALTPALVAGYVDYFKDFGAIEKFGLIDKSSANGMREYRYLLRSASETVTLGLRLDANGKVASVSIVSE